VFSVKLKKRRNIKLLELNNFSRKQVNLVINSSDLLLATSLSEIGPLIVKEAMASIVSTNVGDVIDIIKDTDGCFVTSFDPFDVAEKIGRKTDGRQKIKYLDINIAAEKIMNIYKNVVT